MIARGIASWATKWRLVLKDYHWQMHAKLLLLDRH
jgi:hypothetical protein